ncbi:MAG: hypothetical protein KAH33_01840, partial [Candidatus Delongbacteria bacterium]|nr:hypothetical protein [Candidatus Delongbacteria bacterium]
TVIFTEQLVNIMKKFGSDVEYGSNEEILAEATEIMGENIEKDDIKYVFESTEKDNFFRAFENGCDALVKKFDDEFEAKMK